MRLLIQITAIGERILFGHVPVERVVSLARMQGSIIDHMALSSSGRAMRMTMAILLGRVQGRRREGSSTVVNSEAGESQSSSSHHLPTRSDAMLPAV